MEFRSGGLSNVRGVRCGGARDRKYGVVLVEARGPVAGVFTTNRCAAAPVLWTRRVATRGEAAGVIANSGCANCMTGERGLRDARGMASLGAAVLGCSPEEMAVASTGIIGVPLDLGRVRGLLGKLEMGSSRRSSRAAADGLRTTDLVPKETAVRFRGASLGGVAKGVGMIAPRMATMLAFLVTDARVPPSVLRRALRRAADRSFNQLVIDGDMSTNDMALLITTREGPRVPHAEFERAVEAACVDLARQMARDGEGATRLVEVEVRGARTEAEAARAARAVVGSNLVKAAIYGANPNWGRIAGALGRSGVHLRPERMDVALAGPRGRVFLAKGGISKDRERARPWLRGKEVRIEVDLGVGRAKATAWGCDLSPGYVKINAEYS
ncbi:MAG: bifunctional glutamate N-acetyltransferase/amino-acid acetyltransferase ArgJ [Halobacteria archaeon]